MITLEDCVALSGLTEEEILAIAEVEHVPELAACSIGHYLSEYLGRNDLVRDLIVKDIRTAQRDGRRERVQELLHVLHHFLRSHPDARPDVHPWSSVM